MATRKALGFIAALLFSSLVGIASVAQEAPSSIGELTARAEAGDSAAQFELGNIYFYGQGVVVDNFAAARWFRAAADQDNYNAQYNLAIMYMQGTGVIADMREAVNWFERAAVLGDAPAQFTLATFFANGRVVQQDPVKAHMWFTLAASSGHKAAAANLVLYQEMMSDAQIVQAQDDAAQWIEKFNALREAEKSAEREVGK
jgi:TPR repeat protein